MKALLHCAALAIPLNGGNGGIKIYYILSIIFGLIPEVLYFTLFLIFTKNLKEKRLKLFLLIAISYFICIVVQQWQLLFYLMLIGFIYLTLKILYKQKTQIIDVFIISLAYLWIAILSTILLPLLNHNEYSFYVLSIIDRILLFVPFVFKNNFNKLYKKYCNLWNRNDAEKRPIKSITLRNISLILLNGFILLLNITMINIVNFYK